MPTPTQAVSDSAIQNLLFEEVHPVLLDAINIRSVERKMLDVKKAPVSGKYYRLDQLIGGNFRLEGRPEGGYLPGQNPSAAFQDQAAGLVTMEMRFKRRFLYSTIEFTGPMENAPKTSSGGYDKLSAIVMEQTVKAFPEMVSSKWARGQFAPLGQIAANGVSGNTITLVAANAPATAAVSYPWAGNRFFREGMVLDATSSTSCLAALRTGATDMGRRVTAKSGDGTAPTLTMQDITGSAWAAGDLLYPMGERASTAISSQASYEDNVYSTQGIMDAIANGSDSLYAPLYYGNALVSSNRILQAHQITNTNNTDLTVNMLNQLISLMYNDDLGGEEPDFFYTTLDVYRQFAKPFTTMSNFATNNPARYQNPGKGFTPTVGASGIEVNNIGTTGSKKFMVSPFAPHYRCYAIRKDSLMMLEDQDVGIMSDDGLKLRQIPGTDMWHVAWKWYCSGVVCLQPRRNGLITGLVGDHNNA